jgi:rhodanese-related sulfurtransferase
MDVALADLQDEVSPADVAALHERGEIELVDVREPHEHEAGRIPGARHVEISKLSEAAGGFDPQRPLVFYCHSGGRSAVATQAFRASGFRASNMAGGIAAWAAQGLPLEPEDGSVVH